MRRYEDSHPWITFDARDFNRLEQTAWMLLGEASSKCQHLAGTPLRPDVAQEFWEVTLVKGALASAAIEGNTLSEEQAEGIFRGTYSAPPSREYQEREVRNMIEALSKIDQDIMDGVQLDITPELIRRFNHQVLDGTDYADHVVPGQYRTEAIGVGPYKGPPAEDVEYLVKELADWLDGPMFARDGDPHISFARAVASAVYAHLYIAWIHPFGDGNGRTARLIEFLILARCGQVPLPAAHLLSNHYNLTRDRYYRELQLASETRDTTGFLTYAIQGLVDGIREQIEKVRDQQLRVTWINFVHDAMSLHPPSPARERQIELAVAMPLRAAVDRTQLETLTPSLTRKYAKAGDRTLSRDLTRLASAGLLLKAGRNSYAANARAIEAFLPPMATLD